MAYLRNLFEIATLLNPEHGRAKGVDNKKGQQSWPLEFAYLELADPRQARSALDA